MLFLLACADVPDPPDPPDPPVDADGDGYTTADDCNDNDPDVSPSAREVCDPANVDEDCDGVADDADPSTATHDKGPAFPDGDGDGYGTGEVPTAVCDVLAGFAAETGDCDDGDPAVNPAAAEVCQDGVDNNCDGWSGGCGPWGIGGADDADAAVLGDVVGDFFGGPLANAGDLDGDGNDDILIGDPYDEAGGPEAGAAYVVTDPLAGTVSIADAPYKVVGSATTFYLGGAVVGGGDGDGDGTPDLLLSAAIESTWAVLFVPGAALTPGAVDIAVAGELLSDGFEGLCPSTFAWAGDTDGDGIDDLICGTAVDATAGEVAGAVYTFAGPLEGRLLLDDAIVMYGADAHGAAGTSVAGVGDTNGDGLDDVVIGAWTDRSTDFRAGAAFVVHGPMRADGLSAPDAALLGELHGDYAGWDVAPAGDPDGDGLADILVATQLSVVYLVSGATVGSESLGDAEAVLDCDRGLSLSYGMAEAGDVDGDGRSDLLIGAKDEGTFNTGVAYVMRAPIVSQYLRDRSDQILGAEGTRSLGAAVVGLGDLDDDGFGEVAVSQSYRGAYDVGAVFIYRGGPGF